jgi:hypothetical protein|tara:strand:+ start:75 stop:371 length:297 start_codon:yes stop_codon:yes gene_type:complete
MATKKEKKWLGKASEFGCVVCRKVHGVEDLPPACIHHIRDHTGMGRRSSHADVLPLCHHHHQGKEGVHHIGKNTWEDKYGTQRELQEWFLEQIGGIEC